MFSKQVLNLKVGNLEKKRKNAVNNYHCITTDRVSVSGFHRALL